MKQLFHQLYKQNRGSVISIEFALIMPCLVLMFIFVLEFSRVLLIGSSLDLVMTEVTRSTAISEHDDNYQDLFVAQLQSDFSWWPILASVDKTKLSVTYCSSIHAALNDNCSTQANKQSLILFEASYQYSAIFSPFFNDLIDASLTKKALVYREFYTN